MTGQEFLAWRKGLELNQQEAATRLGVSRRAIIAWEQGETPIDLRTAITTWAIEQVREIEAQLAPLKLGEMHIGGRQVVAGAVIKQDLTSDWIERHERNIAELEDIIAEYRRARLVV